MKNKNLNDWLIALAVIVCSAVLFWVLAQALSGTVPGTGARTVRVNFPDAMGINLGAQVKYAGALVGKVAAIQILSAEERLASGDPRNAVQVLLVLNDSVPPLPADTRVTVAADTLLSEKLILIHAGDPSGPVLDPGAVVQGIPPTTFDQLVRNIDGTLEGLKDLLGGTGDKTGDLFQNLHAILGDTQGLLDEAKPVLADARVLAADARQLIAETKAPITRTVGQLEKTTGTLDALATRANALVVNNEKSLNTAIADAKVTLENLKVTSTYTKILARNLTLRPSQLIWGGKPPPLPSEREILRSARPIPLD